jgi:hypothetical protein
VGRKDRWRRDAWITRVGDRDCGRGKRDLGKRKEEKRKRKREDRKVVERKWNR